MTYHDKSMFRTRVSAMEGGRRKFYRCILRGINDITLHPEPARVHFGSLADDWRAVGEDMRAAMERVKG